jgi:DnaJ-domain-containing protein 1
VWHSLTALRSSPSSHSSLCFFLAASLLSCAASPEGDYIELEVVREFLRGEGISEADIEASFKLMAEDYTMAGHPIHYALQREGYMNEEQAEEAQVVEEAEAKTAKTYFDGGFEDKMSLKEAALILGVSETASRERIMDRYRTLMKINHPDLGGSPFLSLKVNEAKDLMTKALAEDKAAEKKANAAGGKKGPLRTSPPKQE